MVVSSVEIFLAVVQAYLALGFVVAMGFALVGIERVDPSASGSYVFRALLIPGLTLLWPLVLARWSGFAGESSAGIPEGNERRHLMAWTCLAALVPAILIVAALERRLVLPSPASQQVSSQQAKP